MTNTDLDMFMENLRRILFKDQDDLEDAGNNWKTTLVEVAHEAEYIVDMFVSSAIIQHEYVLRLTYQQMTNSRLRYYLTDWSLDEGVMKRLKSIRAEMSNNINNKRNYLFANLVNRQDDKFEATGNTRVNLSATKNEEFVVGFEEDGLAIIDRLTGERRKLDIISIVGMGGLGKTTLATKVFNDSLVEYHFDKRGWVTVSQAYSKRDLLVQLLASIGKSVHEAAAESKLCEMLYQRLKRIRYLIVIDDIWSCKAWDDMGLCFPDDNTGSRVLLTTRLTGVALHASQGGFTHNLGRLNDDQSWELLCRKTFRGYECPENLIETGKRIAKSCGGLPLALVVIAGLLEKVEKRKILWDKIAKSVGSYITSGQKGCLDTLALSYNHLPCHLKKCFLYVGGFPEDYKILVRRLIRLWMAEGFIKESRGQRSLEEEGEYYLMDLIDRNLLIVADRSSSGGVNSCRMHDLLRELCLKKACEETFFKKVSTPTLNRNLDSGSVSSVVKQRRLFTDYEVLTEVNSHDYSHARSVLCFLDNRRLGYHRTTNWVCSFLLLRVLDLLNIPIDGFENIKILVHLRYLAVWSRSHDVLLSETIFCSLQTLVVRGKFQRFIYYPDDMINLRHLRCDRIDFSTDPFVHRLFHLQTISRLRLDHRAQCLLEYFPNIKKLGCSISSTPSSHGLVTFAMLTHLEALNIDAYMREPVTFVNPIRFPETLRKLTLKGLCLPWKHMSTIRQLPKLEVLKLLDSSFMGPLWETGDEHFHQLKFLKLEKLNIRFWEASNINFPCLRKLVLKSCDGLKEIPFELGDVYTLEHIEIDYENSRLLESVNRIQEAQREMGNCDVHVNIIHMDSSEVYFEGDPFYD